MKTIRTAEEFYKEIDQLQDSCENRDLEEYLRALYLVVEHNKSRPLTCELALDLLRQAFLAEPAPFQSEWLTYTAPPDGNRMSQKFTNPVISEKINKTNTSGHNPYDFTIAVIKFQIAELSKMRDKQLQDEMRYFGIQSETGNIWYNFDPLGNLECGVRCMVDNEMSFESIDWSFIGELLENGRVYE